jgi:hypothetical protein
MWNRFSCSEQRKMVKFDEYGNDIADSKKHGVL